MESKTFLPIGDSANFFFSFFVLKEIGDFNTRLCHKETKRQAGVPPSVGIRFYAYTQRRRRRVKPPFDACASCVKGFFSSCAARTEYPTPASLSLPQSLARINKIKRGAHPSRALQKRYFSLSWRFEFLIRLAPSSPICNVFKANFLFFSQGFSHVRNPTPTLSGRRRPPIKQLLRVRTRVQASSGFSLPIHCRPREEAFKKSPAPRFSLVRSLPRSTACPFTNESFFESCTPSFPLLFLIRSPAANAAHISYTECEIHQSYKVKLEPSCFSIQKVKIFSLHSCETVCLAKIVPPLENSNSIVPGCC